MTFRGRYFLIGGVAVLTCVGLIGWQLVGYPGPRMSYRDEIDKHFGQPWRPKPASLEQTAGRQGKPWEDEEG